jgi:hypothetical protein
MITSTKETEQRKMKATLTFQSVETAKDFASKWACKTLSGHDMSAVKSDGSVDVTVYDITEEKKEFIELYISEVA